MNRGRIHLMRFIDLGLLLLLAFLSVAELNPTLQVALPYPSQTTQPAVAARIIFDEYWSGAIHRLDQKETICQTSGIESLRLCLDRQPSMRFLIAPDGGATVQQIVTVLDLCHHTNHLCEIEPLQ